MKSKFNLARRDGRIYFSCNDEQDQKLDAKLDLGAKLEAV